ncbi:hypothetical protein ACJIZ3_013938 [Penstemon smallii]|uniref:Uncharacterized protein n=1 Tax=Penstemon smallii TaxID=265156 RepID=A0ABD3RUB8_9LAMI
MAYASVMLLLQNLEEILHADSYLISVNKDQIEYLHKEVSFLNMFVANSQEKGYDHHEVVKELEILIRNVAHTAADFIDSHLYISNMKHSFPERKVGWNQISLIAHQSYRPIIREIKSVKLKVMKMDEDNIFGGDALPTGNPSAQVLSPSSPNIEDKLVGIDGDINTLLHQLSGMSLSLQVIPILGMGGIGKTTLAARLYNDEYVIYHFYIRAWITVSQGLNVSLSYQLREMLLGILQSFTVITDEIFKSTNEEIGVKLYKTLKGMRYLIVLDNMWEKKAWDNLKRYLPDDKNGSRIILTSRLEDVATYISPGSLPHFMQFLGAAESWKLLESKLYPEEICPVELVEIGKLIAIRCQGLPLAIVVVAGLLNNMGRKLDSWRKIAEGVDSLVANDPEHCMDILALSYNYLPNRLKPCFLYMGAFPEHYEIPVSKLIWLWVAEGFIQPVTGKCLEEVANEYLEDLVSRNLVLIGKKTLSGRIKKCHIHDLLRDLCLREAAKENFQHVIKRDSSINIGKLINPRRISLHASLFTYYRSTTSVPLLRSFLCFDMKKIQQDFLLLNFMDRVDFKLLRVLDIMLVQSNHFPISIIELVHLRLLALAVNCELPGSISKLRNLQTLIIDHIWEAQNLPREIWKMSQLRHIHSKKGCYFPFPYGKGIKEKSQFVLKNIQTLSAVIGCSKEVFDHLPQLRKLEIFATESDIDVQLESKCLSNLISLNELETLKCSFLYRPRMHRLPNWNVFPPKLKKLNICRSYLPWKEMNTLGMLPNLEVLKLGYYAFDGYSWKPVDEGFLRLKVLVMVNSDPVDWDADSSHFPMLQRLILRECQRLTEIPQDIGEIQSLKMIELHDCSTFLVASATKLHVEQQMFGNYELGIQITGGDNHPMESF